MIKNAANSSSAGDETTINMDNLQFQISAAACRKIGTDEIPVNCREIENKQNINELIKR